NATKILIRMYNSEKEYAAKVVGTDPDLDIALLKINAKGKFPYVKLGDSDKINIGDIVVAIGNPFELMSTFTTGVVSATGRKGIDLGTRYQNYIQTDAAINPGNSGGPLINIFGEVIGMNTAILSQSGGNIGIGFAIPVNMIKKIIPDLKSDGKVSRGYLGIGIQEVTEDLAKALGTKAQGVYIPQVFDDTPAAKAGLKAGDIITEYNGTPVKNSYDLRNMVAETKPGTTVRIKVLRDGEDKLFKVTMTELKSEEYSYSEKSDLTKGEFLGLFVSDITDEIRRQYRLYDESGVLILGLNDDSPLQDKGVSRGDIIVRINRNEINNLNDYAAFVNKNGSKKSFIIHIKRGNYVRVIAVNLK
ncbi:PDZ domain-containing protein, partial [Spirochaetota bacterium]